MDVKLLLLFVCLANSQISWWHTVGIHWWHWCCVYQGFEGGDSCSEWRWSFIVFLSRHRSINGQSSVGEPPWAGLCKRWGRNETAAADY